MHGQVDTEQERDDRLTYRIIEHWPPDPLSDKLGPHLA